VSSQGRKKILALLFMLLVLSIPFGMMYYVSTDYYKNRFQEWRMRNETAPALPARTGVKDNQIILLKDKKQQVGKMALVFREYRQKKIFLDVYLLDLDPQQPYPLEIKKQGAKQELLLGEHYYQIVSVNNRYLNIKRLDAYQSP
jgi:hypothetical protein